MFGGPLLALTIAAGGMISPVGMLNALVMSYSRVPYAMAEDGYLPRAFTWTTRHTHAPWVSIVVCAAAWALCLPLGFDRLIQLDIMLYGAALLLEFVALLALRLREPNLPRPFRSPGGVLGIVVLMLGPAFVLVMAMVRGHQEHEGATNPIVLGAALAVAGVVLYFAARSAKSRPAAESA
jgi:amino acid transporter